MLRLSIITVCFNEPHLEETCKSVVEQSFQDFEWIVVDGGSNDEKTIKTLEKYRSRMDIFISEPDTGIYNAMNKGIKLAKGRWLNFLNAGDAYYSPLVLETIFKYKDYSSDIVYGNCFLGNGFMETPPKITKNSFLADGTPVQHQSTFIRRKLFDIYGGYDESNRVISDWEKWIIFSQSGCIFQHIDVIVTNVDPDGISSVVDKAVIAERDAVKNKYFTKKDIKKYQGRWTDRSTFYLFCFIPILKVCQHKRYNYYKFYLFGIIPILKIKNIPN